MMKTSKIDYRGQDRLKVEFPFNDAIADKIRQITGSVWSRSLRAWLVPYTSDAMDAFKSHFPEVELSDLKKEESAISNQNLQPPIPSISSVSMQLAMPSNEIILEIFPKQIWVKIPKDETDIRFV